MTIRFTNNQHDFEFRPFKAEIKNSSTKQSVRFTRYHSGLFYFLFRARWRGWTGFLDADKLLKSLGKEPSRETWHYLTINLQHVKKELTALGLTKNFLIVDNRQIKLGNHIVQVRILY